MTSYVAMNVTVKDASRLLTHHFTSDGEVLVSARLALSGEHYCTIMGIPEVMEDFALKLLEAIYRSRAIVEPVPAAPGYTAHDRADAGEGVLLTTGDTPKEAALLMATEKALKTVERLAYPEV